MAIWDMWYIDEGFLIWIIPLTYLFCESIIWDCTTSFVHTYIYRMFNLLPHIYMYLCSLYCLLCMFSVSDSSIYMIYCHSFNLPYVICYYLYLHTWTTSLDHVHFYLLCTPFGFIYVLAGLHLTALDSYVQILVPGPWWLTVADQSTQRILPWWSECSKSLDVVAALPFSSSPVWLSRSLLLYREYLFVMYISSCIVFFCILSDVIFL